MKKLFIALFTLYACNTFSQGQIYFEEDFETASLMEANLFNQQIEGGWIGIENKKTYWTYSYKSGNSEWSLQSGGAKPAGSNLPKPENAHSGSINALFYRLSLENMYETYLISPEIDLTLAHKPLLTFWYSQYEDQTNDENKNNFEFTLYYRVLDRADTEWKEIRNYNKATDDALPWATDSIYLPEDACKYSQVQVAFLGKTKTVGHGCCIDDVKIEETQITNKYVGSISANHPTTDIIPTSSTDNPIMQIRLPILGNSGTLYLKSIDAIALEQTLRAVTTNGIKLYYTNNETFNTNNLISTASISGNKIRFQNINFDIPNGNAYLWITCDIKDDNNHELRNNIIDIKLEANSIKIGDLTYPTSEFNPIGHRLINESIFFDDFENPTDIWTLVPEFEIAEACDLSLAYPDYTPTTRNPINAHSGINMMGTDITGIGASIGQYETNIGKNAYTATTKTFNCRYYKDISLTFYRCLNIQPADTVTIDVSTDGGQSWTNVWTSSFIYEKQWSFQNINLSRYADHKEDVKLRFGLGPTNSGLTGSGWNIDDVALIGTFIYYDLAIDSIPYPTDGCGYTSQEPITVIIRNIGYNNIETPFPVSYSTDNGKSWVTEMVTKPVLRNDTIEYTFNTLADLSTLGECTIMTKVELENDENQKNNSFSKKYLSIPYFDLPYAENFETTHGYWLSYGTNQTWQHGKPTGTAISSAYSSNRCWVTNLSGEYPIGDSAWLESPCFNMSNIERPLLSFKLKSNTPSTDGLTIYYTIDNGKNWKNIPFGTDYARLKWYNTTNIAAINGPGWSGTFDWQQITQLLPTEIAGKSSVKFRFVFASTATSTLGEGFAIDNISLSESPNDVGIIAVKPETSCYLKTEQPVAITIKNFGIRSIATTDSIFATMKVNNTTLTDTFFVSQALAPNDTTTLTFNKKLNMWNKRDYNITAYTNVLGDTMLFTNINNDTIKRVVSVLGEPNYTLGPDMGTTSPENTYIFGGLQSNGTLFTQYIWKDNLGVETTITNSSLSNKLNKFGANETEYEYTIEVVNSYGCSAFDTIKIINSHTDIAVTSITGLDSAFCINSQTEDISIVVKNASPIYPIEIGEKISLCYTMFDADSNLFTYKEDTILTEELAATDSFIYTFKQRPIFELGGKQKIHFFPSVRADILHENDTATMLVNVWPIPEVDLGADSILTANPNGLVLSTLAIDGATYLWKKDTNPINNSTTNSLTINDKTTKMYSVSVTDQHNCATIEQPIWVVTDNWKIDDIISPVNQCQSTTDNITIRLSNNSENTYPKGYYFYATITIDGVSYKEKITMPDIIPAKTSFNYTFKKPIDIDQAKTIDLSIRINPNRDIDKNDNFIFEDITIWETTEITLPTDTIFTLSIDTVMLDAGQGFTTYTWKYIDIDGYEYDIEQNTQILNVNEHYLEDNGQSKAHTFVVEARNQNGCYNAVQKDSILNNDNQWDYFVKGAVSVYSTDLEIANIISPNNACDIANTNVIKLSISNNGKDQIPAGDTIPLSVKINNREIENINYIITQPIASNAKSEITVPFQPKFVNGEVYDFKVWLNHKYDKFNTNDTMLLNGIKQLPIPQPFSLGDDKLTTRPDTVILVGPEGFRTYTWSSTDNTISDTLRILSLKKSGTKDYILKIANEHGCSVSDTIRVATYDFGIDIIQGASNICLPTPTQIVKGRLSINSNDIIPEGINFTASYNINGESGSYAGTTDKELSKNSHFDFEFNQTIDLSNIGNYTLTADVSIDNLQEANTNNQKEFNFRVGAIELPFEDTIATYDSEYKLDPGSNFKSWTWASESSNNNQPLWVIQTNAYQVEAIDTNNCTTDAAPYVLFVEPKYDITSLGFEAQNICQPLQLSQLSFYLKNNGNDIIAKGSQINIAYTIGANRVDEVYTFTETLQPNDSALISFTTLADIRQSGNYAITFEAKIGDAVNSQSTALFTINVQPRPSVSLGDDIISVESEINLSPGSNYSSYLWNNGAETANISVDKDGKYWVTVSNNFGCTNSDTIAVRFIPPAVTVSKTNIQDINCNKITNQNIDIEIINNGKKDIEPGQTINIKCVINNKTFVEQIKPEISFAVGARLSYTLSEKLNIDALGSYKASFYLDIDGTNPDTATFDFKIIEGPDFNFKNDHITVDKFPYTLSISPIENVTYAWNTGASTNAIEVTNNGTYTLTITSDNGCKTSKSVVVTQSNDIELAYAVDITAYPNPASEYINIDFGGFSNKRQIIIANAAGQIIYTSQQTADIMKIDIADWKSGLYLIKVVDLGKPTLIKFIKE